MYPVRSGGARRPVPFGALADGGGRRETRNRSVETELQERAARTVCHAQLAGDRPGPMGVRVIGKTPGSRCRTSSALSTRPQLPTAQAVLKPQTQIKTSPQKQNHKSPTKQKPKTEGSQKAESKIVEERLVPLGRAGWGRLRWTLAGGRCRAGRALAANLALDPDEPDGGVWPDGGGGCPLVSGRCCISNSIVKGARQRTARRFSSEQNRETQLTADRRTFHHPTRKLSAAILAATLAGGYHAGGLNELA